jgi:hypothetical protein
MGRKGQAPPSVGLRLTEDEKYILAAYGRATGQVRGQIVHELIKAAMPKMATVIVHFETQKQIANDPHAADWTPDLPDAAKDREMRLAREARERKAAQKGN